MSNYPPIEGGGSLVVAYRIADKNVLIVGGGNVAAQRIQSAKIADARVTIVAPAEGLNDEVQYRINTKEVTWIDRPFQDADLDKVDMVLTALDDHDESLRIGHLCRERRIPVNVADVPPMCDFYFMSQHRDGPVQIAVSTNGQGPKLANMIRTTVSEALPANMGAIVKHMGELRAKVREWEPAIENSEKRMGWVTRVCEKWGLQQMARLTTVQDHDAFYASLRTYFEKNEIPAVSDVFPPATPSIALIGAGPGDPELITVKAQRCLKEADLVVSDRLIPQPMLDLVEGELRIARKTQGKSDPAQDELLEWCLEGLKKGQRVVRLKIGDPLVFGRGGEEILWFRERGYEPELVPGISSAFSGPMAAGIPVTMRGVSDQVIVTTGRGTKGSMPDLPDYGSSRTLVVLMAVGRAADLKTILCEQKHYPSDCPVAWIENANCPQERVILGSVANMDALVQEQAIVAPAVLVVGNSVRALSE
ncbi:tetrapyrrole methylase [Zychaea mexicana]|uniref:tetrapyrrole methylase n=1 Tax=Zychaea mexicana TaxID=64656 RepID=UPI0022FF29F0|nr:tetrapyrrole methylase [Zychaea mexicana]KAI9499558.1 tetrapyrrole methylase [Zychaea mexicana]